MITAHAAPTVWNINWIYSREGVETNRAGKAHLCDSALKQQQESLTMKGRGGKKEKERGKFRFLHKQGTTGRVQRHVS